MATGAQNGSLAAPPAPFRQTSPGTIELREGGGRLAIIGLPFFLAGLVMVPTIAGILHIQAAPSGKWTPLILSLAFTVVGSVLLFGRRWLTVDLSRGTVVRQYGLLVPIHTRERRLSEFNVVVVAYYAGDSDSPEKYPVRLRSSSGEDFVIGAPAKFGESLHLAEYLSGFLRLPLVDTTTDHETVVAPERAGRTLRERLLGSGADAQQPVRPLRMRCEVNESTGRATIAIPSGGSWPVRVLSIVLPLVVLFIVIPTLLHLFTRSDTPQFVRFGFLLVLIMLFVLPSIFGSVSLMVASQRKRMTVTASPAGLEIEQGSARRTRTTLIAAADLLDLDCSTADSALKSARASSRRPAEAPSAGTLRLAEILKRWVPAKGIIVKSRGEIISFGEGLPAGELQYLRYVLRRALAGESC